MDPLDQLIADAGAGDPAAFEQVVVRTLDDVWAVCRSLGDPDSAEDLVQETYERALRALPRFRGTGPGRSWLLTIARNTCADSTRRRIRHRARIDGSAEEPEPAYHDADRAVVDDLLATLEPDRREAFALTQLAGCTYPEAARIIGCPIGTVRSRVARARADLLDQARADRTA